jgi:hypothetical protein
MPEKKSASSTATKTPAKASKKSTPVKGETYECSSCGLVVVVDQDCGCADACDIVCCGEPMQQKKPRSKAKAS